MKTLEKGPDKIKKICAILHSEAIEPAQKEAEDIIQEAKKQAEKIVQQARKEAEKHLIDAKEQVKQENNVFQASLLQGSKQALEALRQYIEDKFFNEKLTSLIDKNAADPNLIANLINAIVKALEKDGLGANLTALVPQIVSPKQLNGLLLQDVLKSLKEQSVSVGNFGGGVQVKLNNKQLTIDISDSALKELLATYVTRKDFRKMIFEC